MADWFSAAFGATVADVRQRLVEEPWFDRTVTPGSSTNHQHAAGLSMADRLGWGEREIQRRNHDAPDHDFGR